MRFVIISLAAVVVAVAAFVVNYSAFTFVCAQHDWVTYVRWLLRAGCA